jgi:hypothetical protein
MYVFSDLVFHATDSMGCDRFPEKKLDPVQVVDVQIDQWTTNFVWVIEIWDPGRVGDNPFEVSTDGAAEGSFLDKLGCVCEGAHVGQHVGYKCDSSGFFCGLLDLSATFDGKSYWFFDEDIFAVLHGEDSGIDVKVRRKADVDDIDRRATNELFEGFEDLQSVGIDDFSGRSEITLDSPPIASSFRGVLGGETCEVCEF